MSAKKKKPGKLYINGEEYPAVVLLITKRDEATGRPREGRFLYSEEKVDVVGGEEFLVVFAHGKSLAKRN